MLLVQAIKIGGVGGTLRVIITKSSLRQRPLEDDSLGLSLTY
jgi:hypothetical protein